MIGKSSYRERAAQHMPQSKEGLLHAAREMLRNGLTDHDVAHVLRLDVQQIRRLIGECPGCES
jgi:hypothetical protein